MKERFRVITDGKRYRVQELVDRRFFWKRWQEWKTMRNGDYLIAEFCTQKMAENAIDDIIHSLNTKWEPIERGGTNE